MIERIRSFIIALVIQFVIEPFFKFDTCVKVIGMCKVPPSIEHSFAIVVVVSIAYGSESH